MIQNLKALVVVLTLAGFTFWLIKATCLQFMARQTFVRRRNVWFALTVAAFTLPSFWLYLAVALPLLAWAGRRDEHPTGLYLLMLHVIPPIGFEIPAIGINQLFHIDNYRILALAVLLPAAVGALQLPARREGQSTGVVDLLVLAYAGMLFTTQVQNDTLTNSLRGLFILTLDALLVYYVFSRTCRSRAAIVDAMAAFTIACAIHVPVAVFESLRGWLLYQNLGDVWGSPIAFAYLMRGDSLRAQASLGHALALGYSVAMGLGFWMYLRMRVPKQRDQWLGAIWLWAGLFAAYSRGPWLVGALTYFAFLVLSPGSLGRVFKAMVILGVLGVLILMSPAGDAVIDRLPFVGTIDSENVEYRQRLAELSWAVILQSPLLGNPHALWYLEELRQGQGIIDLVNVYISVTLFHGFLGAGIFFGCFFYSAALAYARARRARGDAADDSLIGAGLLACMVGTLLMLGVGSFGTVLAVMYWALIGLALTFAGLPSESRAQLVEIVRPSSGAHVNRRAER